MIKDLRKDVEVNTQDPEYICCNCKEGEYIREFVMLDGNHLHILSVCFRCPSIHKVLTQIIILDDDLCITRKDNSSRRVALCGLNNDRLDDIARCPFERHEPPLLHSNSV